MLMIQLTLHWKQGTTMSVPLVLGFVRPITLRHRGQRSTPLVLDILACFSVHVNPEHLQCV